MREHALAQVERLADIDQRAALADEAVHAAGLGQVVDEIRRQMGGQGRTATDAVERCVERVGWPLAAQRAPQLRQDLRIGQRAMPRGALESVPGDDRIEVVARLLRIELAGETHRAGERRRERATHPPQLGTHETVVEAGVVGDEAATGEPRLDLVGDGRERRGVGDHLVADPRQLLDGGRDATARVHELAPLPLDLARPHPDDGDLGDAVPGGVPARGLDVDAGDGFVEGGHDGDSISRHAPSPDMLRMARTDMVRKSRYNRAKAAAMGLLTLGTRLAPSLCRRTSPTKD